VQRTLPLGKSSASECSSTHAEMEGSEEGPPSMGSTSSVTATDKMHV
jgi:hypothetical protein